MTERFVEHRELRSILDAIRDTEASTKQLQRLETLVVDDRDARRYVVWQLHLQASLHWSAALAPSDQPTRPRQSKRGDISTKRKPLFPFFKFLGGATDAMPWDAHRLRFSEAFVLLVIVLFCGFFLFSSLLERDKVAGQPDAATPVARLEQVFGARWGGNPDAALAPGTRLRPGQLLTLKTGFAEIRFDGGTNIVLQGPAEFTLLDENAVKLGFGQLVARVPEEARGFAVDAPGARVTDLGTEFGLCVTNTGSSEVRVFEGLVQVAPKISPDQQGQPQHDRPLLLKEKQGVRINSKRGAIQYAPGNSTQFSVMRDVLKGKRPWLAVANAWDDYRTVAKGATTTSADDRGGLPATKNGVWNYYCSETLNPSDRKADLSPLKYGAGGDQGSPLYAGYRGTHNMPAVSNRAFFFKKMDGISSPGELVVHPGEIDHGFAVVRWTSGVHGATRLRLAGRVRVLGTARTGNGSDGIVFALYAKGKQLLQRTIEAADQHGISFDEIVDIPLGSHVDFVVGRNGIFLNDQTGLSATISVEQNQMPTSQDSGGQ